MVTSRCKHTLTHTHLFAQLLLSRMRKHTQVRVHGELVHSSVWQMGSWRCGENM